MMYPPHSSQAIPEMVRAERTWAGIAAVLLCYYGYYVSLPGSTFAEWLFCYTLRIGGPALVLSVLLLQTGKLFALAYDGVVSILIGVGLAVSSVLWLMSGGGGAQTYLNIFFGILFFNSGWRNWSVFAQMQSVDVSAPRRPSDPRTQPTRDQSPSDSLAGRIKRSREQEPQDPPTVPTPDIAEPASPDPGPTPAPELTLDPPARVESPTIPQASAKPPVEDDLADPPSSLESMPPLSSSTKGFLASFADADDDEEKSA